MIKFNFKIFVCLIAFINFKLISFSNNIYLIQKDIQSVFKISKTILIDSNFVDLDVQFQEFVFKTYKNNIFCLSKHLYQGEGYIYYNLLNITTNKIYKLKIENIDKEEYYSTANDFMILSNDSVIVSSYRSIIFFKSSGDDYYKTKKLNIYADIEKFHIYNDTLYGYSNNFYYKIGDKRDSTYSFFVKIDLKTLSISYHFIEKEISNVFTIFQPRSLIDGYRDKIIKISSIGQEIEFTVINLMTLEKKQYSYKPKTWISATGQSFEYINKILKSPIRKYMKNVIDSLRPFMQKYSIITNINFINDSTLFILRTSPKINNEHNYDFSIYIDIIKFTNGKITKIVELNQETLDREKIDKNQPLSAFVKNSWIVKDNCYFVDRNLIIIEKIPYKIDEEFYNNSYKEINNLVEEYLIKYEYLPLQFIILKLSDDYE